MRIMVTFALAFISAGSLFSMNVQSFYQDSFCEGHLEIFIEPSGNPNTNDNEYVTIINKSGSPIVIYDERDVADRIGKARFRQHFWAYNLNENKGLKFQPKWELPELLNSKIDRRQSATVRLSIAGSIQTEDVIIHFGQGTIRFGDRIYCSYNNKTDMIDITHNDKTLKSLRTKYTDPNIHLGISEI